MALDYIETSKKIIEEAGGADNISSASHCMTRLRLVLKDDSKPDDLRMQKISGVKSVIRQGGQYQIVIGNEVANLFKEFSKMGNFAEGSGAAPAQKTEGNPIQRLFGFISGCMTPMLPAMLGCGMLKVILTLLTTFFGMSEAGSTYTLIYAFADCFFTFLPIYLGFTIARRMGGSPMLFMTVGAALCYPALIALMGGESLVLGTFLGMPCTYLFGVPVICATYTSSVLPMLLMAPVMKWAETFADRISPNMLKSFLKPLIFLIICIPVVLYVLGPVGNVAGNLLAGAFMAMYSAVPWLTVAVLAGLMPFIIMTGMHYALIPLAFNNMATVGFDVIVIVTMFCSNLAQGAASLGVSVKSKDTETKSEGLACGISALIAGVTEPALYGINLRYVTPMIGAVAGAAAGGLFCGLTAVRGYVMGGSPSLLTLISFIGGEGNPMRGLIFGAIGAAIVLAIAFSLTLLLFQAHASAREAEEIPADSGKIVLSSPMTGAVVALAKVPDAVFSSGSVGDGVAVVPTKGEILAPCDGTVSAVVDSGHAIGITARDGMELLIHVGLDTVQLNGKYFSYAVRSGDRVKRGDLLIRFDPEQISNAGYRLHTPVLITNPENYTAIRPVQAANVKAGDDLLYIS